MEYIWYYFPISAIINGITSTVLGLFILYKGYYIKLNRYFFLFCASVAFWGYCYFFWQIADNAESAIFWSKGLMIGAMFSAMLYLHVVIIFLGKEKKYKILLIVLYISTFFFALSNVTPYFVGGVEPRAFFKFWPTPGPLLTPFLIPFFFQVLYASYLLFKELKACSGAKKKQVKLLLVGIFIAYVFGTSNYFLWYNIPIVPWGNIGVSFYVILTAWAIFKYNLLNIDMAWKKSLIYGIIIFMNFGFWIWLAPLFGPSMGNIFKINFIFGAFGISFLVAFSLPFLNNLLQKVSPNLPKKPLYLICLALLVTAGLFVHLSYSKLESDRFFINQRTQKIVSVDERSNPQEKNYQVFLISSAIEEDSETAISLAIFYLYIATILLLLSGYIFFTLRSTFPVSKK